MLRNVQLLRALAALMVVVGHLQPLFVRVHPGLAAAGLGRAGVDLFFVISGFVMVYTTDRAQPTPARFAWRRVCRIVPLYWAVTLAVFGLALAAPGLLGASRADPVWLAKSLAFVPFDKGDGTTNPLLPVGWSLNYEMAFYAVFALAMLAGRRWRCPLAAGLMLSAAAPGFVGVPAAGPVAGFYAQPIVAEFAAGMALGVVHRRLGRLRRGAPAAAGLALAGALLAALLASGWAEGEALRVAIAGAASAGVLAVALALERGGAAVAWRPALLVGDASYSIYLTHLFATQASLAAAARLALAGPAAAAAIAAALAGVLAAGVLVYRLFEVPVARALKAFPARPRAALARV